MREDVYSFAPSRSLLPLAVELCGVSYCDGSYRIYRRNSSVWVAEYIVAGTGTVILDGVSHTASAGDVYLLPAGHAHEYFSDGLHPWTKLFFNAAGPVIRNLAEDYGLVGRVVFKDCPLEPLFRELLAIAAEGTPYAERLPRFTLQIHRILLALYRHVGREDAVPPETRRMKEYIDGRMAENMTLGGLARTFHRSEDYIIRQFRAAFGQTPYAYYMERRMELARMLLTGTNLPVGQIAAKTGFEDPHYFSNRFRAFTRLSPSDYRRQSRRTE